MTETSKGTMAEDKQKSSMSQENANAIQRELKYKQKIANLFSDTTDFFPLEGKRRKALISKRNRSTEGIVDCSQTPTPTCKYAKVSQETFESNDEINARGTISRSNSNVKRQKALISKDSKFAGRMIDSSLPTFIHTKVSQETFKCLESDEQTVLTNHFPSMTSPPSPSFSSAYTYSCRENNAGSSYSGSLSPQQLHTTNVMHYCKDCEVYCSGALCYEQHLRGNKHKVKLQSWGDSSSNGKNKQVKCDLCEIYCQDKTLLEMHLKGLKHKAKQHELEDQQKIKEEKGQGFWCELCQVPCTNEETFTLHLNGKKHRRQVYVVEEKKKADSAMTSFVST